MEDLHEFDSISPYSDEEAVKALNAVADHPAVPGISQYLFPNEPETFMRDILKDIKSVDEFQTMIMSKAIEWVLHNTAHIFSYDGINNIKQGGRFLALSNHRDIILDPAITQEVLYSNGLPMTQIAVGDNLLSSKTIEYLLRSNRMITVIRGISARELYLSSQKLSRYIRHTITSDTSSIWMAQRQGRTKDGIDTTEQGLLKMLDMSGTKSFEENFKELNILPLSISYEYEPCDIRKARELLIKKTTNNYVKAPKEDLHSIIIGIRQQKGNIHLNIGKPLTDEEIHNAANCGRNDRYQAIRHAVDKRVIEGYRLWKTNYMGYDLADHSFKYADKYTPQDLENFVQYAEKQLDTVKDENLNRNELREIFFRIYGNPVALREKLDKENKTPGSDD